MVSLDSVVIALSQIKVGNEVFSLFRLFPCLKKGALRVLYGNLMLTRSLPSGSDLISNGWLHTTRILIGG